MLTCSAVNAALVMLLFVCTYVCKGPQGVRVPAAPVVSLLPGLHERLMWGEVGGEEVVNETLRGCLFACTSHPCLWCAHSMTGDTRFFYGPLDDEDVEAAIQLLNDSGLVHLCACSRAWRLLVPLPLQASLQAWFLDLLAGFLAATGIRGLEPSVEGGPCVPGSDAVAPAARRLVGNVGNEVSTACVGWWWRGMAPHLFRLPFRSVLSNRH